LTRTRRSLQAILGAARQGASAVLLRRVERSPRKKPPRSRTTTGRRESR
jgi:hypothetical protein